MKSKSPPPLDRKSLKSCVSSPFTKKSNAATHCRVLTKALSGLRGNMYWGEGSALGLLTFVGYLLFTFVAALVWRGRDQFSAWIQHQSCSHRRSFSPYTLVPPSSD